MSTNTNFPRPDRTDGLCLTCPYMGKCGQPTSCPGDETMARNPRISSAYDVEDLVAEELEGQYIVITIGLPGCGKTSWAKRQCVALHPGFHRVNRDDIRRELGFKYDPRRENEVSIIQERRIREWLDKGHSVIVDDTHLDPHHIAGREKIAAEYSATVKTVSFMHVPVEECIRRDLSSERQRNDQSVGKDVIETLYAKYWSRQETPDNSGDLRGWLCDLDGTLCLLPAGVYYPAAHNRDYTLDRCNVAVKTAINALEREVYVILLSGREDKHRAATVQWLEENEVLYDELIMRATGDQRADFIVKKELYMGNVWGKYDVIGVLDDRPSVVRMWRHELNLPTFQTAANIEF